MLTGMRLIEIDWVRKEFCCTAAPALYHGKRRKGMERGKQPLLVYLTNPRSANTGKHKINLV